jgi:hypothetical protein
MSVRRRTNGSRPKLGKKKRGGAKSRKNSQVAPAPSPSPSKSESPLKILYRTPSPVSSPPSSHPSRKVIPFIGTPQSPEDSTPTNTPHGSKYMKPVLNSVLTSTPDSIRSRLFNRKTRKSG